MVLDAALLNTQHYKVRIKGKGEQSRERSSSPTSRCCSYLKKSLQVTLDYGRQLYFYFSYTREIVFVVKSYGYILYILSPDIGLAVRVFANGPGDLGSIPGRVIPKTQKMVLDASLLNTQHYKVWIKSKVEQSRERSSALPYTLV